MIMLFPLCGKIIQDTVDLILGTHVDTPCGLINDKDLRVRQQTAA